jgi:N12 class adenine-specific DNA methylase
MSLRPLYSRENLMAVQKAEQKPMASRAIRGASEVAEEHLRILSKVVSISDKIEASSKRTSKNVPIKRGVGRR